MGKNDKFNSPKDNTSFRDEFYGRSKEVNESIRKANFIYRRDANNAVNAKNFAGKEVNDLSSRLNKKKNISYSSQETASEASASTSAASTAGSTVASVAVATTTAVVIAVGGGALIYSQTFTRPAICEMKAMVDDNAIHYSLMVGDDKEKIFSGEETGECNLFVELVCDKYETPMLNEISEYGIHDGVFEDLEYDTEYTLGVYMMEFMDINKAYLVEPTTYYISSNTEPEPEPEPQTDYISIDATRDTNDNWTFYITVSYFEDLSMYHDFYVELYEASYDDEGKPIPIDPNNGEGNFVCYSQLGENYTARQEVSFDIMNYDGSYWVAFGGMTELGENIESLHPPLRADELTSRAFFWELIDFSTISVEIIEIEPQDTLHLEAVSDPFDNREYYVYADLYDDNPEYYDHYMLYFYHVNFDEETGEIIDFYDPANTYNYETYYYFPGGDYATRQLMDDFYLPLEDRYYWVLFSVDSYDPADVGESSDSDSGSDYITLTLFYTLVDLYDIPIQMVETHNEFFAQGRASNGFTTYFGYLMLEEPQYYSNMYWQLVDMDENNEITYVYASDEGILPNSRFMFDFTLESIDIYYEYTIVFGGDSLKPSDIEDYEEVNTDHEEGEPVPVSVIYSQKITFNNLRTDYLPAPISDVSFDFRQSYSGAGEVSAYFDFLDIPVGSPNYWDLTTIWVRFVDVGNDYWYVDVPFEVDEEDDTLYHASGDSIDSLWYFLFNESHEGITAYCSCLDIYFGTNDNHYLKCFDKYLTNEDLVYEYIPGSVWFTSETNHTLNARIMYEGDNPYSDMYIKFIKSDDTTVYYYKYDMEPGVVYDITEPAILDGGYWYIETYGFLEDSSTPTLVYRELLNLSEIIVESI